LASPVTGPTRRVTRAPLWRRALCLVALITSCAVPMASVPAGAQTQQGDKKQQLQDQIGEASAEESAALADLQAIRDRKAAIEARVADLDQQLTVAESRLEQLEAEAARLEQVVARVRARLERAQAKLDRAQAALDVTAAQSYRSARIGSEYELVLAAPPAELVHSTAYLDRVSAKRDRVVRAVTRLRDAVDTQRSRVEAEKTRADAAEADAHSTRDGVARLREELEPARAEATQQEAAEQLALASIQARKSEFEAELESLEAASEAIAAQLRANGSFGTAASPCDARPVPGGIGSGFGPRVHPIYGGTRMHTGDDMHASFGEPIHACRAGTVISAGWNGGYGNCVVIDHGAGMATLYGHQSSIAVAAGDHVDAGQVIGYVGSTGASTGPHLHFEVRLNGNPVDPAPYL
jgi:murein DD-endopeptidase MepM/ murein hydrolase activator NlpD